MPCGIYIRTKKRTWKLSDEIKNSDAWKERNRNLSIARKGVKRRPFSQEWKDNIGNGLRGKKIGPQTEEHKKNMVEGRIKKKKRNIWKIYV